MNEQKGRPMPNIGFRFMSIFFKIRDWFLNPRRILEKLGIKEGQRVLDFGCGGGSYTIPAAEMVGEEGKVYALDIHPLSREYIEKKARRKGLTNITTILSDRDTRLPDESIDIVLLYDTIHMIKDKRALLKELRRVMKTNGLLSILVEHMKVSDVLEIAQRDGLFSLTDRQGRLLNLEKRQRHDG